LKAFCSLYNELDGRLIGNFFSKETNTDLTINKQISKSIRYTQLDNSLFQFKHSTKAFFENTQIGMAHTFFNGSHLEWNEIRLKRMREELNIFGYTLENIHISNKNKEIIRIIKSQGTLSQIIIFERLFCNKIIDILGYHHG